MVRSSGKTRSKSWQQSQKTRWRVPRGATDIRTAWAEYAKSTALRVPVSIPKKYNRHSVLSVDVKAEGQNTFDFKLAGR
jgi:hypothetical protein